VRVPRAIVVAPLFDERSFVVDSAIVIAEDFKEIKKELRNSSLRVTLIFVKKSTEAANYGATGERNKQFS
jgi:hypothetical protein